jgi:hypothetical protein
LFPLNVKLKLYLTSVGAINEREKLLTFLVVPWINVRSSHVWFLVMSGFNWRIHWLF